MNFTHIPTSASDNQEITVTIAPIGKRIFAYILNTIFTILAMVPLLFSISAYLTNTNQRLTSFSSPSPTLLFIGLATPMIYTIVQVWFMSRHGQSLGKKILRICVIKTDGSNAGFWGTVMLREVVFNIVVALASGILGALVSLLIGGAATSEQVANLASSGIIISCFVMACDSKRDRRTLQDLLADTVVVALPEKNSRHK